MPNGPNDDLTKCWRNKSDGSEHVFINQTKRVVKKDKITGCVSLTTEPDNFLECENKGCFYFLGKSKESKGT